MTANAMHAPAGPRRLKWTPELVGRFWDGVGQSRLKELSFTRTGGTSILVVLDHLLSPNMRILDFGAGDGDLVRAMCERGLQAAAYEPSVERTANLQAQLASVPGFLGVCGPDAQDQFDVVTMTEVIEHVLDEELEECLQRLSALVKPGGLLVITTPNNEDLELNMAFCPVSQLLYHRWQHVRSIQPEVLEGVLEHFGFRTVVTHLLQFADHLYQPFDRRSGLQVPEAMWPQYMRDIRANRPARAGTQSNILYIGRRQ